MKKKIPDKSILLLLLYFNNKLLNYVFKNNNFCYFRIIIYVYLKENREEKQHT